MRVLIVGLLGSGLIAGVAWPLSAQTVVISRAEGNFNAPAKAKNLARQAAEITNGGLQVYQAEAAMHEPAFDAPFVEEEDHWVFTIEGGSPGFEVPTIRTVVRVDKDSFETAVLSNDEI